MRIRSVAAALGVLCLVAVLGAITPAAAGFNGNYVVVDKVVDGPVPAGTVFEIEVACSQVISGTSADATPSGPPPAPVTLKFDANGDPLAANKVSAAPGQSCKVSETVTGGATVSYACAITPPTNGAAPTNGTELASCVDDQTVAFGDISGAEGTVTVTNTFEPEPPPAPAAPPAPAVVAARPAFTG